ncbi:unnamed protein product [Ambrosiozyma monospora]|uniref:Unnamed protein product n=1 Tax=Ambrosiozyma monospora TaxID=43982 RepID=A0ACB5SS79_AMBMO|nr:unnamed protein product [Ambrosiozyma monospora]
MADDIAFYLSAATTPLVGFYSIVHFLYITPLRLLLDIVIYGTVVLPYTIFSFFTGVEVSYSLPDTIEFFKIFYQYVAVAGFLGLFIGLNNGILMSVINTVINTKVSSVEVFSIRRTLYWIIEQGINLVYWVFDEIVAGLYWVLLQVPVVNGYVAKPATQKTPEDVVKEKLHMTQAQLKRYLASGLYLDRKLQPVSATAYSIFPEYSGHDVYTSSSSTAAAAPVSAGSNSTVYPVKSEPVTTSVGESKKLVDTTTPSTSLSYSFGPVAPSSSSAPYHKHKTTSQSQSTTLSSASVIPELEKQISTETEELLGTTKSDFNTGSKLSGADESNLRSRKTTVHAAHSTFHDDDSDDDDSNENAYNQFPEPPPILHPTVGGGADSSATTPETGSAPGSPSKNAVFSDALDDLNYSGTTTTTGGQAVDDLSLNASSSSSTVRPYNVGSGKKN